MIFRKNTEYDQFMDHYLEQQTEGLEEKIPEAEYDLLGDYNLEQYKED